MSSIAKNAVALLTFAVLLLLPVMAAAQAQPLTITNGPKIEYVGPKTADIAWTTSTGGSTILRYGTNPNNLNQTAQEPYAAGQGSQHVTHRVQVSNLQPATTYYFMVDSAQGQGTGTEAKSPVQSFTTKPEGGSGQGSAGGQLQITDGPRVEYTGPNSAEIAWTTSTGGSSVIHYGTDPNNLSQTAESPYSRSDAPPTGQHAVHRVTIKNLQPHTTYYYVVESGQGQGTGTDVKSPVQQFKTK
jgi:phosphodiesterase/alkaline phosphatase D-like protein